MKIPNIVITNEHMRYRLEEETLLFLIIISLHYNKIITDDKLKGMFKGLRDKSLNKFRNTYHCTINNRWYNDESMLSILSEVHDELCPRTDLELDVVLSYLNKYLSRNKNFCIDWVYFSILHLLINSNNDYIFKFLRSEFGINMSSEFMTFTEAKEHGYLDGSYCCEDCDGDYNEHLRNQYEYLYGRHAMENFEKRFKAYLLTQKTHLKNPNERLI